MKIKKFSEKPSDLKDRIGAKPIVCYPNTNIEEKNLSILHSAREHLVKKEEVIIPPRDAKTFEVKFGEFFRIESVEGPQVGDLNLFNLNNLEEKFYSGKTRALYGTHLSVGDKMFSSFPYLRSLATITWDTLDWYDYDKDGGSVHDVIGTRCDPYTSKLLSDNDYHYCCRFKHCRLTYHDRNSEKKRYWNLNYNGIFKSCNKADISQTRALYRVNWVHFWRTSWPFAKLASA